MKITITSNVENGSFKRNRNRIREAVQSFEGKEVDVTIQKKKKQRSSPQNRYYFGVIIVLLCDAIKTEWGEIWGREKSHEFLKSKFLFTERINEETGEILRIPKSTTECTTIEFEEYLLQCRTFLQEWFNTEAPLPNEQINLL